MNAAPALHTAARRYALARHAHWRAQYATLVRNRRDRERDGYHYTPEALATFPRYNVWQAIRIEVERLDPEALDDVEQTRMLLLRAGSTAQNEFTSQPFGYIDSQAMAEERDDFCRYIESLGDSDLEAVPELPYRRVLIPSEAQTVWTQLQTRWEISDEFWFPLAECRLPGVMAFRATSFHAGGADEVLRRLLAARSIERIWVLHDSGPEYLADLELFDPYYRGAEGYWSSDDLGWIVYASHENSITIGGWLLNEFQTHWPAWSAHEWTGACE